MRLHYTGFVGTGGRCDILGHDIYFDAGGNSCKVDGEDTGDVPDEVWVHASEVPGFAVVVDPAPPVTKPPAEPPASPVEPVTPEDPPSDPPADDGEKKSKGK